VASNWCIGVCVGLWQICDFMRSWPDKAGGYGVYLSVRRSAFECDESGRRS